MFVKVKAKVRSYCPLKLKRKPHFREALLLVLRTGKSLHLIEGEIVRWRDILAVPYQEYPLSR